MYVRGLIRLVAIEIEPKSIHSQNCRHMLQIDVSASEMGAERGRVMEGSVEGNVFYAY